MYPGIVIVGSGTFLFFPIFDEVGGAVGIRNPVKWPGLASLGVFTSPPYPVSLLVTVLLDNLDDLPPRILIGAGAGISPTPVGS
jgi:hypothetical protein